MEIWYFETSAVDSFRQSISLDDALATRQLQQAKGRDWRLSTVTLWEILMTSDADKRDEIVHFCQHLFGRELLPSPSELIIPYIEQGMPKVENYRELISNTMLASTWRDLIDDRNRYFIFDHEELKKRVKVSRHFSKNIHRIINNQDQILSYDSPLVDLDCSLNDLVDELPFVKSGEKLHPDERLEYKISIFYILLVLCAEAEIDNQSIKQFWQRRGINSTIDRVFYIVRELDALVYRDPFIIMSCMTIAQAQGKYSRGVLFDSFHSMYLPYIDHLFTTDGHFEGLRSVLPESILSQKIHLMDEFEVVKQPLIL